MPFLNKNQEAFAFSKAHNFPAAHVGGERREMLRSTEHPAFASAQRDPPPIHTAPTEKKMPTELGGNSNPHINFQNYRNSRLSKLTGTNSRT